MKRLSAFLALMALALAGCSSIEMPGSARYFANQPGGQPLFRVASGPTGPTLSAVGPDGKWTKARVMKTVRSDEAPFNTTPGLAAMVESAHRIDNFVFLEFKPTAKVGGKPVPSRYFLLPGGFAYVVPAANR
jgi:hypothetical protein